MQKKARSLEKRIQHNENAMKKIESNLSGLRKGMLEFNQMHAKLKKT
jgi:hypothetical protein